MLTLYIVLNGDKEQYQLESLLDIDPLVVKWITNLMEKDIKKFKSFVEKSFIRKITLSHYSDFVFINTRKRINLEIYFDDYVHPPMYIDVDYWINRIYEELT